MYALLPYLPIALLILAGLCTAWWALNYIPKTPGEFRRFCEYQRGLRDCPTEWEDRWLDATFLGDSLICIGLWAATWAVSHFV